MDVEKWENGVAVNAEGLPIKDEGALVRGEVDKPLRSIGSVAIVTASFNILQTWFGVASTLGIGLSNGGPVTIIYGLILMSIVYTATALSLAELSARYPTAGGQYHWTSVLAPQNLSCSLSYACGSINAIGRITICASVAIIVAKFLLGIVAFCDESYIIQSWHVVILYQCINIVALIYDTFILQRIPWTHNVAFIVSIFTLITVTFTCLAVANPKQPSSRIWSGFINDSGWNDKAIVFLTGLVNPNYGFGGLDGAVHLAEDCANATTVVPLATILGIVSGVVTAFFFVVSMLYCVKDVGLVLSSRTGIPIFEIIAQATESRAATIVFMILLTSVAFLTLLGSVLAASKITWSFARDEALLFSRFIKQTNPKLGVPISALCFNAFWIFAIGCIYLGSTTAFNTIVGTGLLIEQISYAFPAALLMWRRRGPQYLPQKSRYNLGRAGWLINSIIVAWTCLVLVIYSFPTVKPVSAQNMNYTCVVLFGVSLVTIANWFLYAKRHYHGPSISLLVGTTSAEARQNTRVYSA